MSLDYWTFTNFWSNTLRQPVDVIIVTQFWVPIQLLSSVHQDLEDGCYENKVFFSWSHTKELFFFLCTDTSIVLYYFWSQSLYICVFSEISLTPPLFLGLQQHIPGEIPTHKFLPLMTQLSARLCDESNDLQSVLSQLVTKTATQHPHHVLPILFSLKCASTDTQKNQTVPAETKVC